MDGVAKVEDFEFLDFELSNIDAGGETDEEEEKKASETYEEKQKRLNPHGLGFVDDDDDEDADNRESVQAHSYDRTFIVSGPVVKVYKQADAQEDRGKLALNYEMALPKLKSEDGFTIRPSNVMLHDQESRLIFTDENDTSQLYNFDLETGKIVERFQAQDDMDWAKLRHLASAKKNAQAHPDATLVGVGEKAIFTMDTRVAGKAKAVQEKLYKTNPEFSQVSTTLAGGLAVGSLKGEIRLYKEVG